MPTIGGSLELSAQRVPDRIAMVWKDARTTYRELDADVDRVARALQRRGVAKGDRVAFIGKNCDGFVLAIYAAARLGAIFVPINPRSAAPEVAHVLRDSGATVAIAEAASADVLTDAAASVEPSPALLGWGDCTLEDLAALAAGEDAGALGIDVDESDDAMLLYTSGTTGLAKGVLMDHHRLIWTGLSISVQTAGMRDGASLLHVAPLYHAGQTTLMLLAGTLVGAKHVVLDAFVPDEVLDTMERERTTAFFGPPTMLQFLMQAYLAKPRDLSAWDMAVYGAAPMPESLAASLQREFESVRIFSCYGQTEAGPGGFYSSPEEVRRTPGVTGYRAFPNTLTRVVHPDGTEVGAGEVGEVLLKGETIMKRYWNNPEATEAAFTDGWLHTGDLARVDENGGMTIVDRLKDMIITGGRNVYSAEVENALASHPGVADVAALGRPHPEFGETVVVIVTPREGADVSLESIRAHAAERIGDYKLPREVIVGTVPRNASGKILKHVLRAEHGLAASTR